MMQTINILYGINEGYVKHCLASIVSLLENTKHPELIHFSVLINGIGAKSKKIMQDKVISYGATISFIIIDDASLQNLDTGFITHYATFFRLLMDTYLPRTFSKILYLDADTIILSDIIDLYAIDIGDAIVGVVEEVVPPDGVLEKLSLKKYFNAGVMLINLSHWKRKNIGGKSLEYLSVYGNVGYADQDALNVVLQDHWFSLPQEWNTLCHIPSFVKDKKILHYTLLKPWIFSHHATSNTAIYYFRYLFMTGFLTIKDYLLYYKVYVFSRIRLFLSHFL